MERVLETIIGQVDSWEPDQGNHKGVVVSDYWGNLSVRIENIRFENMRDGVYTGYEFVDNSVFEISGCIFSGNKGSLWLLGVDGTALISECNFRNQKRALKSPTWFNQITMTNSVVESVTDCTLFLSNTGNLSIQNCNLAKGENGVVVVQDQYSCYHTLTLDMTNNYWGTDDPDSISAWIQDRNDSEDACYFVDFEPFNSESTPVEKKTIGGFRAMYR